MKKQKRWVIIPVTTAVLLALAGCGGQDNNTSQASNTPTSTSGEQTQSGSGGPIFQTLQKEAMRQQARPIMKITQRVPPVLPGAKQPKHKGNPA